MNRLMKSLLGMLLLLVATDEVWAQSCSTPGQNPSTAFPVCGTSVFAQASVPICGGRAVPNSGCNSNILTDKNPFWYKFTCFESGSLGFRITPLTLSEDYDWQVFDVTGRNPDEVYTNVSLGIGSNWSGEGGVTGASTAGNRLFVCEGFGQPLFSSMPNLVVGHDYLLLVSHFSDSQSGYNLQFTGGTAVITDSTQPHLKRVEANCGGDILRVKLNKKMKCSTITGSGSEFFVTPAGIVTVTGATAIDCSAKFDTDSIELLLNQPLPPGNYQLNMRAGTDGNTILDYCDKPIPTTDKLDFVIVPRAPTPMDSLAPVACAPQSLRLVFRKPMRCSTVAPDGSDFSVTGSYPVTVTGAACAGGTANAREIIVNLSKPLLTAGNFTLTLRTGTDGNTILDECSEETPAGSFLNFSVKDTVNADFSFIIRQGCLFDTVDYIHPGGNGVDRWNWSLDEGLSSTIQNPQARYRIFDEKTVRLIVSNGFCSDTASGKVALTNFFSADFTANEFNCPNEPVSFRFSGVGNIARYDWFFGDGDVGTGISLNHLYPVFNTDKTYAVRLTVTDVLGCQKSITKRITVVRSCFIGVPTGFTPNGDGRNDKLFPMYAIKANNLDFRVYNRWGQLLFTTNDWRRGWDGTFKGIPQEPATYVWTLRYTDRDTGQPVSQRGTTVLIR